MTVLLALSTAACGSDSDDPSSGDDAGADVAEDQASDSSDDADASDDADTTDAGADADTGDASDDAGDAEPGDAGEDADTGDASDDAPASPKDLGEACSASDECGSGHCVDGVCCEAACDGTCEACDIEGSVGTCTAVPEGEDPSDECEDEGAETCGTTGACDGARACAKYAAGTVCRPAAGDCDLAETCPGDGAACPDDAYAPSTVTCRAAAGVCDVAESCPGDGPDCPVDAFVPSTTVCRPVAGDCDVEETCTGVGPNCPVDAFVTDARVCRPYQGLCDKEERCNGMSATCPADAFMAFGQQDQAGCTYPVQGKSCDGEGFGDAHCVYADGRAGALCTHPSHCNSNSCVNKRCQ